VALPYPTSPDVVPGPTVHGADEGTSSWINHIEHKGPINLGPPNRATC